MMPTPMVAETATTKAAVATPVRERETSTPRQAIRPITPKSAPNTGRESRARSTTPAGTRSAYPTMRANRPAKLPVMPQDSTESTHAPKRSIRQPEQSATGKSFLLRDSRNERARTARGGAPVASRAGGSAAASVARMPSAAPLARVPGKSGTRLTSRTK